MVPATAIPESPFPIPRGAALALAALGPVAIGAIVAAITGTAAPVAATPAILFGVTAATSPALYIALAALGDAPPLARVARALAIGLGAFGIALAGLVLPAAFLALSATTQQTTIVVATAALAGGALLGLRRLRHELGARTLGGDVLFAVWAFATLGIAGRLWWDLATEVLP